KYSLPDGLPALRALVARKHCEHTGMIVDPDRNITITAGNMQGLNALLHVLVNPGDEVIVTDPGFASHFQQIKLVGGRPVHWPLDESASWALDVGALPELIGERTKAVILVTPSNPTGKIFSRESLLAAGRIARERNVPILLDDPYSDITYENAGRYFNLASEPELFDWLAYLFTFSKSYAMSGWRLGYMIVPEHLKKEILKVHDATLICAPRVSQVAGIAALSEPPRHLAEFRDALAGRRKLICDRLDAVPHVFDYAKPEGAYYVFPRITAKHRDSREFALRLLDEAAVTVTPGGAFGPSGEHHVRMAYCVEDDVIDLAFDRIERHFGR
ncbi:MAG: pyridoxal phosphate-dependent aminotransferase, partial [Gammaproteobacteria bacterium]